MQTEIDQSVAAMDASTTSESPAPTANISATAPGQIRVIKRNGTVVPYDDSKISVAITKAFLAVEGGTAAASSRIHETVAKLTEQVSATFKRRMPSGGTIHIEDIQDQVELSLMRTGEHKIARDYVIYREEHARRRAEKTEQEPDGETSSMIYTSGTTGKPKGVRRETATPEQYQELLKVVGRVLGVEPGVSTVVPAPMYHSAPNAFCVYAMQLAAFLVIQPRFDPEELLAIIEKYKVTRLQMVPTMFVRLTNIACRTNVCV